MEGKAIMAKGILHLFFALVVPLAGASIALGGEAEIRRMLQEKLRGGGQLESLQKAPFGDLYEAVIRSPDGAIIYYVDSRATAIIAGRVIDAKSGRDLTEERLRGLNAVKWDSLPLQWGITMVRGNGRRKIAVLSDPNCPYCKRLEEDLARLDDITVHILPYPVLGPESVRLTKAVWCSRDRAKAWTELMFRRIEPRGGADCDTPIERLQAYGRSIRANSTPTWFLETGERFSGALPFEEVRRLLDAASPAKR
jgi:thiol:disulfide interchange protein DsbC